MSDPIRLTTEAEVQAYIREKLTPFEPEDGWYPHSSLMYGSGYWLKRFLDLPESTPLFNIEMPHSAYLMLYGIKGQVERLRVPYLAYTQRQLDYLEAQGLRTEIMGSPFVHCRKLLELEQADDAAGTLAFPTHSTIETIWKDQQQTYLRELDELPEQFGPLSICLYYKDLMRGDYKPYIEKGYTVYCAGHMLDPQFPANFYRIVRQFKYTTASIFGSNAFYAIEMGIPFFLHGSIPQKEVEWVQDKGKTFVNHRFDVIGSKERRLDELLIFDLEKEVDIHPEFLHYTRQTLGLEDPINKDALRQLIRKQVQRYRISQLIPNWLKKVLRPG